MASNRQIAEESRASQGINELEWLLNEVAKIKPKVVLEIGVHLGYSLKAWQDAFKPERIIGVDTETNDILRILLMDELRRIVFIKADSHEASTVKEVEKYLNGMSVDFLFLDGDHTLAGVEKDYELYSPLVRKGGIIAFHDASITDHPLVDVHKFLKKLKGVKVYQSDANGVGVIHV